MAANFNGTSQHLLLPYRAAMNTNTFSFSFWLWSSSTATALQAIISRRNGTRTTRAFEILSASNRIRLTVLGTNFTLNGNKPVSVWTHYVCQYDRNTGVVQIYVNGVLQLSSTATINIPTNITTAITVACRDTGSIGTRWPGILADVRMYNRTLTAAEVMNVYTMKGRDRVKQGLVFRYRLNEGLRAAETVSVAKDQMGLFNATSVGSPVYAESPLLHGVRY